MVERMDSNLAEVSQAAELLVLGTPGKSMWDISWQHCLELSEIMFMYLPYIGYHIGVGMEERTLLINRMPWAPTDNHRGRYIPENVEDTVLIQGFNLIFYIDQDN